MPSVAHAETVHHGRAGAAFAYQVHDALRHLHDLVYLQAHPLARMLDERVPGSYHGGRGRAVQQALREAIESLRPASNIPPESRTWRTYRLLTLRFAEGFDPGEVREQLAIGRSEYFREQRRALDAVTLAVRERWGLLDDEQGSPEQVPTSLGPVARTLGAMGSAERPGLPSAPGMFVGREEELAEVYSRLGENRLVTLTGAPGTGKTRLALEAAGRMRAAFPGGVFFVDLTPLGDPGLVIPAIARLLHQHGDSAQSLIQSLQEALHDRAVLIILDNLEHLLAAAPELFELMEACPSLRILATSRARLHVTGECELPVAPLPVPTASHPSGEEALQHTAVALFVARAREARSSFVLTDENASDVVEICTRLDGLPLAIELAAARIKYLTLKQLLARLRNRLALLVGGARDRPPRQQTLRGAITWSYELLTPGEQAILRRLAVFSGGWTLEAAEEVLGGAPAQDFAHGGADIFDGLVALVDHSLVREDEESEDGPRFDMLGTIRDFAAEQMDASGETEALRERHAVYYAALAAQAATLGMAMLDVLEREHDNMRLALDWYTERNDADGALRLSLALSDFWRIRGYYAEGSARLDAALAMPGAHHPSSARALALRRQGTLAMEIGDYRASRESTEQALELYRTLGDESGVAHALHQLTRLAAAEGNHAEARELGTRSLAILRALGQREGTASALLTLARVMIVHYDEPATARVLLEEAVDLLRSSPGSRWLAQALCLLGEVACAQGDYTEARRWFAESLIVLGHVRDPAATAEVLVGLAGVAAAEANGERALHLAGAAESLHEKIGAPQPVIWRRELSRRLAPAVRSLDRASHDTAWRAGREMNTQRAIALAIEFATMSD